MIAEIEGGTRACIVGTGLAAVMVPLLAYLKTGDHCLMPDSVYGPGAQHRRRADDGLGHRDQLLRSLHRRGRHRRPDPPNTKVVYTESPGSHTFEIQDIPAIARAAHAAGCKVMMDNTWGIHHFMPFQHGVDVSIQALTKYVGGHSDVLLGSVTVNSEEDWQIVRGAASQLGQFASPDDVWLGLRGVRTMPVRLKRQEASGLEVARWFEAQPQVSRCCTRPCRRTPARAVEARLHRGLQPVRRGVKPSYTMDDVMRFIDALQFFGIGASWGGYESLALPTGGFITRTAGSGDFGGPMARIHIGLEEPADLIADLARASPRWTLSEGHSGFHLADPDRRGAHAERHHGPAPEPRHLHAAARCRTSASRWPISRWRSRAEPGLGLPAAARRRLSAALRLPARHDGRGGAVRLGMRCAGHRPQGMLGVMLGAGVLIGLALACTASAMAMSVASRAGAARRCAARCWAWSRPPARWAR